jgi:2-phosphosulfolactate phosphatase
VTYGSRIAVIPAGEQWPDGSLRPAFEDWVGAGAIIHYLAGSRSPEAQAAALTYEGLQSQLRTLMQQCGSGQELIERGFEQDVELAATLNVSDCVPILLAGAYVKDGRSSMVEV